MTRVELLPGVLDDLKWIVDHLQRHEVEQAQARGAEVVSAIQVLADNPLIGGPVDNDRRELVIGRGAHGYVALYQYAALVDTVFVLAIRAQREGGYARP
ncbi:MAG: type II toxin-antitoxin system RelE/ParE family toxin [Salinisphaera sp.]|nr:type II toxin-antitoxin system RelE/ParE family toxin [Salinisphaera sp.]